MFDFSTVVREKKSFNKLLNVFKKQFWRPPTVICLIKRAADNLINFQAVVKKRLSKFELLKCCRIFPTAIRQTSHVTRSCSNAAANCVCSRAYSTLLREKGMSVFRTTRLRHLILTESTISTVVVKWSSIQSDITPNSDTRREQLATSLDKNRAM